MLSELVELSRQMRGSPASFLQLLMSVRTPDTLNRIINCPTYPLPKTSSDLSYRISLFSDILSEERTRVSDVLSFMYCSSVSQDSRKAKGQYFTPSSIADRITSILPDLKNKSILDPGCGTGSFPVSIAENKNNEHDQSKYLGVESDPLLALATAFSLESIHAPASWKVIYRNFMLLSRDGLQGYLPIGVVICNPPFVRFQRTARESTLIDKNQRRITDKNNIESLIEADIRIPSLSGSHMYFLAHSASLLEENGEMIFILPSGIESLDYGAKVLTQLKRCFKVNIVEDRISSWHSIDNCQTTTPDVDISILKFVKVCRKLEDGAHRDNYADQSGFFHLREIARVHRGISTGCNSFFILSKSKVAELQLTGDHLEKVVPTRIRLPSERIDYEDWVALCKQNKPCWLLSISRTRSFNSLDRHIRAYIDRGVVKGIHDLPTCRNRRPWYSVPMQNPPDLIFTYFSRNNPRFLVNAARLNILTNLLGVYFEPRVRPEEVDKLCEALNSSLSEWIKSKEVGRLYAKGLRKFEPSDILELPIATGSLTFHPLPPGSLRTFWQAQNGQ